MLWKQKSNKPKLSWAIFRGTLLCWKLPEGSPSKALASWALGQSAPCPRKGQDGTERGRDEVLGRMGDQTGERDKERGTHGPPRRFQQINQSFKRICEN